MDIHTILEKAGLSQQELADRIVARFGGKLGQTSVSKWAKRGIPLERKPQIAAVTGISLKTLAPELFREHRKAS